MTKYNISEEHIFSSRGLSFADGAKHMTGGKVSMWCPTVLQVGC